MSILENDIEKVFIDHSVIYEKQKRIPIVSYPWKIKENALGPKSDFYLPKIDLYIEVKGFMTIEAM